MAQEVASTAGEGRTTESRLAFAIRMIERDAELRFFIRHFLSQLGALPQQSVFSLDALQNAFDQGRQAAGIELISILSSVVPELWPALQLEAMTDV